MGRLPRQGWRLSIVDKAAQLEQLAGSVPRAPLQEGKSILLTLKAEIGGILGNTSDTQQLFGAVDNAVGAFDSADAAYGNFASMVTEQANFHRAK